MSTRTDAAVLAAAASAARRANLIAVLSWLAPGAGYFWLKKWTRGALVSAAIIGMFLLGLGLQGQIYQFSQLGDLLSILGWIGDVCGGGMYFLTQILGAGAGNAYTVWGNYGTTFLICAGLLNLLAATDVRDIALGRKK